VTTSLAFRVLLSHFLPGLLALPGGIALTTLLLWLLQPQSCTSLTCHPEIWTDCVLNWSRDNVALATLAAIAIPLIFGILLDDWRHGFWPCREDDDPRWQEATTQLARLPSHLFRFMHDEYYYYVEFDGNSFLAVGFSGLFVLLNYLRTNALMLSWHSVIIVAIHLFVPAVLLIFLWRSYNEALNNFFEDLSATA
jgi:hypothetical protein